MIYIHGEISSGSFILSYGYAAAFWPFVAFFPYASDL